MKYCLELAVSHLKNQKKARKTFLIVFFAVVVILLNYGATNAVRNVMTRSAKEVVTGDVLVCNSDYTFSLTGNKTSKLSYIENATDLASELMGKGDVKKILKRINSSAVMSGPKNDEYITLIGIEKAREDIGILEGKTSLENNEIMITEALARNMGINVGDEITLKVNGAPFNSAVSVCRVVAIFDNSRFGFMRDSHVLMDLTELQEILAHKDSVTHLMLYIDEKDEDYCNRMQGLYENMNFMTSAESADLIYSIQDGMMIVMAAFVLIMTFVSAVIISNLSLSYLKNQAKEIAVMKALGMGKGSIVLVYLIENSLAEVGMGGFGAILSVIIIKVVGRIGIPIGMAQKLFGDAKISLSVEPSQVAFTLIILFTCGLLASLVSVLLTVRKTSVRILQ